MDTPPEPVVVAEYGGVALAEIGPRVLVLDRGSGISELTVVGTAVVAVVGCVFGSATLWSALVGGWGARSTLIAAAILALGVGSFGLMLRFGTSVHRRRLRPLSEFRPVAVFDRERRVFLDEYGEVVAPLEQVRFVGRPRLGGSTLVAVTPSGSRVLQRRGVFGGGTGPLAAVLTELVHGARR